MASLRMGAAVRPIGGTGRRRAWLVTTLVGLVALVAATASLTASPRMTRTPALRVGVVPDYVSAPPDGRTVFTLGPASLGDAGAKVTLDGGAYGRTLSGDGTTWASLERTLTATQDIVRDSVTIVVRDGPTGRERARVTPSTLVCCPLLSRDGSRLLVMGLEHGGLRGAFERFTIETSADVAPTNWMLVDLNGMAVATRFTAWSVYDTATGRLLAAAPAPAPESDVWWSWLDPAGRWLYQLLVTGAPSALAPRPLRLVVYDVGGGGEIGRLDLPGVAAGSWTTPASGDQPESGHLTRPGVALAPDGRRLALAHADGAVVTLVDTERLAVERVVALTHRAGVLDWLGLGPRAAAAKGLVEETVRLASFAPDGRHLYLAGWVLDQGTDRGLGLWRIDLDTGQVAAEALADEVIAQVVAAPDGHSLYALGTDRPSSRWGRPPHRLRRLDAATLTVLAERTFDGPRRLLTWPAGRPPS